MRRPGERPSVNEYVQALMRIIEDEITLHTGDDQTIHIQRSILPMATDAVDEDLKANGWRLVRYGHGLGVVDTGRGTVRIQNNLITTLPSFAIEPDT